MEPLDNILSGQGEAMPASPEPQTNTTQPDAAQPGQQTDAETDVEGTTVGPDGQKMVPLAAAQDARQKAKRYTEEVSSLRQEIAQRDQAWERRIAQLMEAQKPPQQQQAPPDMFENPDGAIEYRVRQLIGPVLQQQREREHFNARLAAESRHGEKLDEAVTAFDQATAAGQIDPQEYQRIMSSPNPFHEAVQWHQKQQRLAPDYESKIRADERAKALQELGIQPGTQAAPNGAAPVMPSNLAGARNVGTRSGPAWGGPTSLGSIFKT